MERNILTSGALESEDDFPSEVLHGDPLHAMHCQEFSLRGASCVRPHQNSGSRPPSFEALVPPSGAPALLGGSDLDNLATEGKSMMASGSPSNKGKSVIAEGKIDASDHKFKETVRIALEAIENCHQQEIQTLRSQISNMEVTNDLEGHHEHSNSMHDLVDRFAKPQVDSAAEAAGSRKGRRRRKTAAAAAAAASEGGSANGNGKGAGAAICLDQNAHTLAELRIGMLKTTPLVDEYIAPYGYSDIIDGIRSVQFCGEPGEVWPTRVATSLIFVSLSNLAIVANTVYLGWLADFSVRTGYSRIEELRSGNVANVAAASDLPDYLFAAWFTVELAIRIIAEKKSFFFGEDKWWNLFDVCLVLFSYFEIAFELVKLSSMRIFRVFRLVRMVRVVRTVKALKSLRTMLFAIINSFAALLWAFVMLGVVIFVFSILFDNAVASWFETLDGEDVEKLRKAELVNASFGTLWETMVSLYSAISGGNDWMAYGEILRHLEFGEMYFVLYMFYIGFCMIGLMNVVTGMFVDAAVCTRTEDEVVHGFQDDQRRIAEEVRRIFKEADGDRSGTMSYREFERHLQHPWVRAYFSGLEIDTTDAAVLFTLMDKDGNQEVSIDEFVDGTMKLKGHAKSIDLFSMMFDSARYQARLQLLCSFVEEQIDDLKWMIRPESALDLESRERMFKPTDHVLAELDQTYGRFVSNSSADGSGKRKSALLDQAIPNYHL